MTTVPISDITEEMPSFTTRDPQVVLEWMAVISALGGDYFSSFEDSTWIIFVPPENFPFFSRQIAAYESERALFEKRLARQKVHITLSDETSYSAFHVSFLLLIIHLVAGPSNANGPLIESGAFAVSEFFNGQWWRPVTALTLHADILHWASNAMFLVFFAPALCRHIGSSITWFLVLLGGIAGNITTGFFYAEPHRSLGASTAVFAALGLLAGLAVILKIKRDSRLAYTAFMAGLGMLALTGLNPESDILAHIFGFVYGVLSAVPGYLLHKHCLKLKYKTVMWLITITVLIVAWNAAITHSHTG